MKLIGICLTFLLFNLSIVAQPGIGQWREHLSYKNATDLVQKGEDIVVASGEALFIYDTKTAEIDRFSRLDGLSEAGISTIAYHEDLDILIIAYKSGNLDLIDAGDIFNLSDIKRNKSILGNKGINHILLHDDFAYLSCGFGIVKLNLKKKEFSETYFIGDQSTNVFIYQSTLFRDSLFSATPSGIYKAAINDPLIIDYNSWTKIDINISLDGETVNFRDSVINSIAANEDFLIFNHKSSQFNSDMQAYYTGQEFHRMSTSIDFPLNRINMLNNEFFLCGNFWAQHYNKSLNLVHSFDGAELKMTSLIYGADENYWASDAEWGLLRKKEYVWKFKPSGPKSNNMTTIHYSDGNIVMSHGGKGTDWKPQYRTELGSIFANETWTTLDNGDFTILDIESLTADPSDPNVLWGSSYFKGLVKFENNIAIEHYTPENSDIPLRTNTSEGEAWIVDLNFDEDGKLWLLNSQNAFPLTSLSQDGTWENISFGATVSNVALTRDLMITSRGQKWISVKDDGIVVYDETNTGSKYKKLRNFAGSGNLKTSDILCMAEDNNGKVWMGTTEGLSIIHNPRNIFNGGNYDADRVLIFFDGNWEELFDGQQINDIAVDGGNRKWFATNNGAYLTSEDGVEQIHHFTTENSAILSNNIQEVTIDQKTGEVFFGTDLGLISFMADAVDADLDGSDVKIFPNPVPPDFQGEIAIDGLLENTSLKITDISGNIVYETQSQGGRAVWDGVTLDGRTVQSGVYIVLSADEEGSLSEVGRFLLIR